MTKHITKLGYFLLLIGWFLTPQVNAQESSQEVLISGARFTNELFEKWIGDYQKEYPTATFRIENKGAAEFSDADLIVHAHNLDKSEIDGDREYVSIARYAILPVANEKSPIAQAYGTKGINRDQIKQIFFFDPFESQDKAAFKVPYNVYTRVQKAPSPIVFAAAFGYEQQHLHGRAIAGADIHLIKAVQRDSLGVTYSPLSLIYSPESGEIASGLQIIPVDFDGNGRVSDEERFYGSRALVLEKLTSEQSGNIPVAEIQLSISSEGAKPEAVQFLIWILSKGQESLSQHGYLAPDAKVLQKELVKLGDTGIQP